jgi:nucleoside-diphosphate-sugar epimerase
MMARIQLKSPQRALVSGATGFIGRVLYQQLHEKRVRVRGGMRHAVEGPWDEVAILDLAAEGLPEDALTDVDTVFHLAGKAHALSENQQDEEEYFRINTAGTGTLLEAARAAGVRRFVFISSVKAMGEGGDVCQNENEVCQPETPYGKSKLAAERLVLEGGYVPEPVVLRLSMVYGPSRKGNLPRMIEAVAKGRFPPLPELANKRSMVHVEDVVQAALLAAEKPAAVGQTYIVTDGQFVSTRQLYDWICEALDRPVPAWTIPIGVLKVLAKVGDGIGGMRGRRFLIDSDALDKLMSSACYSSEKIQRELGFRPTWNLRSALPEIVSNLGMKRVGD